MQEVASVGVVEPLPPPTEIEGLASAWMSHDGFHEKIESEMPAFSVINRHALFGRGIGYVDAYLLAAVQLTAGAQLWTKDGRLPGLPLNWVGHDVVPETLS